ncbi:MAG: NUDIX domain-containing protein, partial [Burkholderiales bacterium]
LPAPDAPPEAVAEVRHAFTHFRLRARVWSVELAGAAPPPAPDGHLWLPLDEAAGAPLPRPVKTLLTGPVVRGGDLT